MFYASVVSRESVSISLLDAALSGLDILSRNDQNACISAPFRENIHYREGREFGSEAGQIMIVKMALYGLK